MANIAGFSLSEYVQVASAMDAQENVGWLEVNISCPNVHDDGKTFADSPKSAAQVCQAIKEVTTKPIIMKLSPNSAIVTDIAQACQESGADALSLINTFVGMRLNLHNGKPILANRTGGVSYPCLSHGNKNGVGRDPRRRYSGDRYRWDQQRSRCY